MLMRGDMGEDFHDPRQRMFTHFYFLGGAAAVVSSAWAIAKLGLSYVQFILFYFKNC